MFSRSIDLTRPRSRGWAVATAASSLLVMDASGNAHKIKAEVGVMKEHTELILISYYFGS